VEIEEGKEGNEKDNQEVGKAEKLKTKRNRIVLFVVVYLTTLSASQTI
jgi:hypothetical protein